MPTSSSTASAGSPTPRSAGSGVTDPGPASAASHESITRRIHLTAAGISVLLDVTDSRIPAVLHWGAALGSLTEAEADTLAATAITPIPGNSPDEPLRVGILPQLADCWTGRPGLSGARADGSAFTPDLRTVAVRLDDASVAASFVESGPATVSFDLVDAPAGLALRLDVQLLPTGLLRTRATLTNTAAAPYLLGGLSLALPVPQEANELLDMAGRWGKERVPQREVWNVGLHLRENRRGRTGADSAYVLHAGSAGFGFRHGEVWAVHTAFSGNHTHFAERMTNGSQVLGGGELLLPGELQLGQGEAYTSPWIYGNYTDDGLDTIAHRFHDHLRTRGERGAFPYPSADRPVTINVWEAVYFDHDLARLKDLADRAAAVGVERYVLDDGWFGSRRNDRSGLGDWVVSQDMWPDGLSPIIDHVHGLGMQFGLWFEPEMVNMDSDVVRAHPDWVMAPTPDRLPRESRHQQVLNLTIPEAFDHVFTQVDAILSQYPIDYIKWDHNRDLLESATRSTGVAATHAQTLAFYRLLDALKTAHPGLEVESCASGGGRVDLEVLERADRIWVSDCIDPLERLQMNRWTSQLVPLELMGSHIASTPNHTTGRRHELAFRAGSALLGHLGIEWDLREASDADLEDLRAVIALFKERRDLLFTGDLVRADRGEDSLGLTGVVARDRSRALFALSCVATPDVALVGRLRLPGLDPARRYRVLPREVGAPSADGRPRTKGWPAWARDGRGLSDGVELSGAALGRSGLAAPLMRPEALILLEVSAVDG